MNRQRIFEILEIEETFDESSIQQAYRKKLSVTNPEDDAAGFMQLREAYEGALRLIKEKEQENLEEADDLNNKPYLPDRADISAPVQIWLDKVKDVYTSIRKRFDADEWRALLDDEILQDLEYGEEAKQSLFLYLADSFRLNSATYRLLDTYFNISEDADSFKEFLPRGFVDYILDKIQDEKGYRDFPFEWFEGDEYADYDEYIVGQEYLEKQVSEKNIEEAKVSLDTLKDYGIYHPFTVVEEAKLYMLMEQKEEALELVEGLIQKYPDSMRIPHEVAEIYWQCGMKQEAAEIFNKLMEKGDMSALKYIALHLKEHGAVLQAAKDGTEYLNHVYDEEFEPILREMQQQALDEYYDKEALDDDTLIIILDCCYGLQKPNEGLALLNKHTHFPDERKYEFYITFYNMSNEHEKALEAIAHWNQVLQGCDEQMRKNSMPTVYFYKARAYYKIAVSHEHERYITRENEGKVKPFDETILENAEKAIKKAIALDGEAYVFKEAYLNILIDMKKYQEAYDYASELLQRDPQWFTALTYKQEACFYLEKSQEVIDLFYEAKEVYAKWSQIYELAAETFWLYEMTEDVRKILDAAVEEEVTSPKLKVLEIKYLFQRDTNYYDSLQEMEAFQKGTALVEAFEKEEQKPDRKVMADLYRLLASMIYMVFSNERQKEIKTSIKYMKLAIELMPNADNYYTYGLLLIAYKQDEQAVLELEYAEKICDDENLKQRIVVRLRDCYFRLIEPLHSDYYARKVIAIDTALIEKNYDLAEAYQTRCDAYLEIGEFQKAISDARAVLKLKKNSEEAYFSLSEAYTGLRQFDKALFYLGKIVSGQCEVRPRYNLHRAMLYEAKKDYKKAEKYYLAGYNNYNEDYSSDSLFVDAIIELYKKTQNFRKVKKWMRVKDYSSSYHYQWELLQLNYNTCNNDEKKAAILEEIKKLVRKWEVFYKGALHKEYYYDNVYIIGNIYMYYLHDAKNAERIYKIYKNTHAKRSNRNMMYTYYVQHNTALAKAYADRYMEEIKEKYAFNPSESAEVQFVNAPYDKRLNIFDIVIYWLSHGDLKKAKEYLVHMNQCNRCYYCINEECTDIFELWGLVYEAQGDIDKALICYKKACGLRYNNDVPIWKINLLSRE